MNDTTHYYMGLPSHARLTALPPVIQDAIANTEFRGVTQST